MATTVYRCALEMYLQHWKTILAASGLVAAFYDGGMLIGSLLMQEGLFRSIFAGVWGVLCAPLWLGFVSLMLRLIGERPVGVRHLLRPYKKELLLSRCLLFALLPLAVEWAMRGLSSGCFALAARVQTSFQMWAYLFWWVAMLCKSAFHFWFWALPVVLLIRSSRPVAQLLHNAPAALAGVRGQQARLWLECSGFYLMIGLAHWMVYSAHGWMLVGVSLVAFVLRAVLMPFLLLGQVFFCLKALDGQE